MMNCKHFSLQVNAHTELAIRYNDISVLENHHAAVCFQLLQATFLLSNLTKEQFKEVPKLPSYFFACVHSFAVVWSTVSPCGCVHHSGD